MNLSSSEPFKRVQSSMEMLGIWSKKRTMKLQIYRFIYFVVCILFNISSTLGFYQQLKTGKIALLCSNLAMLLVGSYGSIAILMQNQEDFYYWLSDMFCIEKFLNNHPNEKLKSIYRYTMKNIWPETLFRLNKWSIIIAELMMAGVFFIYTATKLRTREECIAREDCSMIYIGYYYSPWNVDKYYWFANFENVAFGGFCCIVVYWRDMYFTCFMCYLRCKLKVLCYVIGHLDEFIVGSLDETEYFWETEYLIKQCIREHQNIIREFHTLDRYLSKIFGTMLFVNSVVIVNTTIVIFQEDNTSSFALFVYCGAFYGCSHLFLMLSQSEELSSQSLELADSIYFTNWYEMDVKHQKLLFIMLIRAQKPFNLTCGGLYPANLHTFRKTMKTVYTIVNALINLNK